MRDALRTIFSGVVPRAHIVPDRWASGNLVFPATDPVPGPLDLARSPYLIDVLKAWELLPGQGLKKLCAVGPQQTGKTLTWLGGLLWSLDMDPGTSLIYYTSEEVAKKINSHKVEPLLRNIPRFRDLLLLPRSHSAEAYHLAENTVYFGGVGSRIASFSARRLIADELDDWQFTKGTDPLKDLEMRSRAFSESLLVAVCTPKGATSRIWGLFKESSEGYYTLRCQGCGELTMRSCDIHNLQFATTDDGVLVPDSIHLVCPLCHHSHTEDLAERMVQQGGYIHRKPELLLTRPGFQWGALASLISPQLRWQNIAEAQLRAGKTGSLADQIYFDNSIRARPFKVRAVADQADGALRRNAVPLPEPDKIRFRFFSADTQDMKWYWIVRGVDQSFNSYLLATGEAVTFAELTGAYTATYHGGKVNMGIIDEGGHRARQIRLWAAKQRGVMTYKGNPRIQTEKNYKLSTEVKNLMLVREGYYRLLLLYTLYTPRREGACNWYVTQKLPKEYTEQMSDWRPNPQGKHKFEEFDLWISSGNDHYFDCEKQMLALLDYFRYEIFPRMLMTQTKIVRK